MSEQASLKKVENKAVERAINNDNFRRWFGDSQVVDSSGKPVVVYRGDYRADKVGSSFDVNKTVSGRFYFSEDPKVASSYATGKQWVDEDRDYQYYDYFKVQSDRDGQFYNLKDAWKKLSGAKRVQIIKKAKQVNINDDWDVITHEHAGAKIPQDQVDSIANRETGRNYLWALAEAFLASGLMIIEHDDEARETFENILEYVGFELDEIEYDNPRDARSGVTPVFLSIERPLITTEIDEYLYDELLNQVEEDWEVNEFGADQWDKATKSKEVWFEQLADDIENNKTSAWTSIPEAITVALQEIGYDGIKDVGGKITGNPEHTVWIAFEPEQIKSVYNQGDWNPESKNIMESNNKKLLKEFNKRDEDILDWVFEVWNQIYNDVKGAQSVGALVIEELNCYIISDEISPTLKKYKVSIVLGNLSRNYLGQLIKSNDHPILSKYSDKYSILLNIKDYRRGGRLNYENIIENPDLELDLIKQDILDLLDKKKHVFVHEFVHLLDIETDITGITWERGEQQSKSGEFKDYLQSDIEWSALFKEMYSEIFHAYKKLKKQIPDIFKSDKLIRGNLDDFITFWSFYSHRLRGFMKHKDKLDPKYQKKLMTRLYKLQQYMKEKL